MRLARKLIGALALGILLVLGVYSWIRLDRERLLFDSDIRRDHREVGLILASSVAAEWQTSGRERALSLVGAANALKGDFDLRWVSLRGDPAHQPVLVEAARNAVLEDEVVHVPLRAQLVAGRARATPDGSDWLITYHPIVAGDLERGALEISESLALKQSYLATSLKNQALATLLVLVVCVVIILLLGLWLVGRPMALLAEKARRVGAGDLTELHERSRRRSGPFVALNCAAVPESLLESELFGHIRGAFTDARGARLGLMVEAGGGTLFLDEVGDLPLGLQPKLLRALQERKVRPLGAAQEVAFDARIVAATNRDLETAVSEGRFREDLFYRINVINLSLPPLRARGGDILLLAEHFLAHFAALAGKDIHGIRRRASERLLAYTWPGNVRELQNCIERAVALTRSDQLELEDLPERIQNHRRSHVLVLSDDPSELVPLEQVERRYILRVLEAVKGNKTLAAQVLGLGRKTLYRRLAQYGFDVEGDGSD